MKSEARIQQEIVIWFNNEHPTLRGTLCYNNNNSVGGRRGNINKYLGVVAGRSDMVLYYKGVAYMIELKNEIGSQQPEQKVWQKLMESHGFPYHIIRSLEEFQELIKTIL